LISDSYCGMGWSLHCDWEAVPTASAPSFAARIAAGCVEKSWNMPSIPAIFVLSSTILPRESECFGYWYSF